MLTEGGTVVVVGHGTSLKGARLGQRIDACDVVVRLKNCSMLLAEHVDYGRKTDVMCSSTEVLHHLHRVKAKEYWGYAKKGFYNKAGEWNLARKTEFSKIHIPVELVSFWNEFFRNELKANHPNVSTGVGALIIALDRFKPDVVYLAGFDKVLSPHSEGYKCTVPTLFNKNGTQDTGHDWVAEKKLLAYLCAFYKTKVLNLAGSDDLSPGRLQPVREAVSPIAT
jgi:hypothetical protein